MRINTRQILNPLTKIRSEMEPLNWTTEKRKINDLIPYDKNPRQMTEKQIEDLKKSLEKFGLAEIPAINTNNMIVAGHQRLKIMQLLGRGDEEVDVRVPNRELTEEEFKEYNIRSNKNNGEWDFDILANNFNQDDLIGWGFEEAELLKDVGLDAIEGVEVDENRLFVLTVEAPESPKLKERMAFYCENIEDYNRIKNHFEKSRSELDVNKLLEII